MFEPKSPTASVQPNVPTVEVAQDWAKVTTSTPLDFEKLRCMFIAEWLDISINGTPENWSWTIARSIRRFGPVRNTYDYLGVIAEDRPQQMPANPLVQTVSGPAILVSPPQQVSVVDRRQSGE